MTSSMHLQRAGPLLLAVPLVLAAGYCGRASGGAQVVCTLSADGSPAPALHGRRRLLVSVREGSSPLEGAEVSLRVESGAGKLTEAVVITGPGGAAVTGLASGSEGQVVVSAALTGGETSVACGQLELRFGAAHFPVVQTDLVRVFR